MRIKISVAIFYVLLLAKLAGFSPVADWSWWIVTAPLWAYPLALLLFYVSTALILAVVKVTRGLR